MEFTFCDRFHRIPIFQPHGDPLGVVSVAVDEKNTEAEMDSKLRVFKQT